MSKLCLGLLLLLVILFVASVAIWRFSKNLGVSVKFRIYLISIVVIIVTAIYLSFYISNLTDSKNSNTNNKEEAIFQL